MIILTGTMLLATKCGSNFHNADCLQIEDTVRVKPCGETDVERRHQEDSEEPGKEQHVEAKSKTGREQEEEEASHPHYPQETKTVTENKVPGIWCEDLWTLPVEAPEPTTTLQSCG
ncbi:hypothetical protein NDU88_010065 [Pleurodeles waltl]|uniref:Uncharacterized protein n=1 Tax=Pleurodeles waltl TaxID=8319 RepID=A0AAV7PX63_PLEWA|nr:hypothetical protein NDU88_010065 [Pleurodeles waltl]